jgi:hypothetical protein
MMTSTVTRQGGVVAVPDMNARLLASCALLAFTLGGCSSDIGSTLGTVNLNPFKGDALNSADYNYFYKREANNTGYVSPNDLVGPDGRCAFDPAPAYTPGPAAAPEPPQAAAPPSSEPINPRSNQALYFTAGPETGRTGASQAAMPPEVRTGPSGIALGMTECEVVRVAGYTERVEVGGDRGQRLVTLTYMSGNRPGIYRFRDGRLVTMDRVEVAAPPPKKPQRVAKNQKSNSAKPKKSPPASPPPQ